MAATPKKIFRPLLLDNNVMIITNNGTPTDGTSGTYAGKAGPGSICIDYSNAILYINNGTKASPIWDPVATQATT